jgi:hypothetical protein
MSFLIGSYSPDLTDCHMNQFSNIGGIDIVDPEIVCGMCVLCVVGCLVEHQAFTHWVPYHLSQLRLPSQPPDMTCSLGVDRL